MTRIAVIDNGVVENIIEADPSFTIAGKTLVPASNAGIGWTWNGSQFSPPPKPDPPVTPDWDGFNAALLADVRLNQVCGAAFQVGAFLAVTGLPAALTQVTTNGVDSFALVFNAVCQYGGATPDDRLAWAAIAEANALPPDFVAAVRG